MLLQLFIYNKASTVFLHAYYRTFSAAAAAAAAAFAPYKGLAKVYYVLSLYYYIKKIIIIINIAYIFSGFQIYSQLFVYYVLLYKIICYQFNNLNL